jgi:hypothetical protein
MEERVRNEQVRRSLPVVVQHGDCSVERSESSESREHAG